MRIYKKERAQSIVLIVISMIGLIAMSALIIDGGNAYLKRRNAQTAADAAALAGAFEYCVNDGSTAPGGSVETVINQYAVSENLATTVDNWGIVDGDLVVTVSLTDRTFFAKVFGQESTTVRAEAAASCFSVGFLGGLLPIAWTCRPPIPGEDLLGGDECAIKGIDYNDFEQIKLAGLDFDDVPGDILDEGTPGSPNTYYDDLTNSEPKMIYLIADSLKVAGMLEEVCEELNLPDIPPPDGDNGDPPLVGTVDCDFDPEDGIIDVDGGARRGWLLMDGEDNQGASILFKIVNGEIDVATDTPRWFAGMSGGKTSAFGEIRDVRTGDYALIPVFDAVCDTDDPVNDQINCPVYYGSSEEVVYANGTADYLYFRVNGFAVFYVSCVSKVPGDKCPGKERALAHDVIEPNTSTVEGYFIENYVPPNAGIGENALDLGVYVLSLTE